MTTRLTLCAACVAAAVGLAACGSSDDKDSNSSAKPTPLAVTATESGKTVTYQAPATTKGGLVEVSLTNRGRQPHSAQLVRYTGGHTAAEAIKVVSSDSPKTPDWVRGQGGLGPVGPGMSAKATVNLPAGKYIVADSGGPGSSGPPGYRAFDVTKGEDGDLPSTPTTITADETGKDKFKWDIQGPLKAGPNNVTFVSKGDEAIHFIGAVRVTGNPSLAEIKKAFASQGPPPKFLDPSSFYTTAVLDGGLSQTTPLPISKPGEYVLFCPLSDRDGGRSHDQEGLLTTVQVR